MMTKLANFCIIFACVVMMGCGPSPPYPVVPFSGTLTYQGEPLGQEMILTLIPAEGRLSTAIVAADGKFKAEYTGDLSGVQTGKLTVNLGVYGMSNPIAAEPDISSLSPRVQEALKKYAFDTSDFTIEVTGKETGYKLDLP